MKKKEIIICSVLTLIVGGLITFGAYAEGKDVLLQITSTLSLSVPEQTNLDIAVAGEGTFGSTYFDVLASTNNSNGYTLTMTTDKTYLESETIDPNTGNGAKIEAIPYVAGGITADAFGASTDSNVLNHWGVSVDNTTSYNPIKLSEIIKETSEEATGDATRINLATKANSAIIPAKYTTMINFQLVANVVEPDEGTEFLNDDEDPTEDSTHIDGRKNSVTYGGGTLARAYEVYYTNTLHKSMYVPIRNIDTGEYTGAYKLATVGRDYDGIAASEYRFAMQDMVPEICANTTVVPSELQVLDLRDNKTYWIAKLADGHCWMTQSLDLMLDSSKALTSLDTDLSYYGDKGYTTNFGYSSNNGVISWIPGNSTRIASVNNEGYFTNEFDARLYASPSSMYVGNYYQTDDYFEPYECNFVAGQRCINYFTNNPVNRNEHRRIGVYYNYTAAIASNYSYEFKINSRSGTENTPQNSICPKGWRLPTTIGDDPTVAGSRDEINRLRYVYYDSEPGTVSSRTLMSAPLYMTRSGYIADCKTSSYDSLCYTGQNTQYWTSTIYNEYSAYYLYTGSSSVSSDFTTYSSKYNQMNVRCIAR